MKQITDTAILPGQVADSVQDLTNLHDQLREKYKNVNPDKVTTDAHTTALMSFNGYYSLNNAPGAFFSVDTNMIIVNGSTNPIYDISLIVSLDGTTSHVYPLTSGKWTFDGSHLVINQQAFSPGVPNVDLLFTRVNDSSCVTARLSGTIALPNESPVEIVGTTYNNIIPMTMYEGEYYDKFLGLFEIPEMQIGANYSLNYRANQFGAEIKPIENYIYNMNMYFFSFYEGQNLVKLIMGTSASGGMVCNNIIIPPGKGAELQTRMLQTGTKSSAYKGTGINAKSQELAQFAGFYLISSTQQGGLQSGAYLSVEGQYTVSAPGVAPDYSVTVGVSLDGTTSEVYTIDTSATFENNTLTIPSVVGGLGAIVINFNRAYVPTPDGRFGSLMSVSGTIDAVPFTGSTPLNPVPLSAFGGVPLTDLKKSEVLTIVSDTEIKYNGNTYTKFLYIPVMYILAFEAPNSNVVVLSLGTDGGKGTACIVTNNANTEPVITSVFGIPDGKSGLPSIPN